MELMAANAALFFVLGMLLGLRFRVHVLIPAFALVALEAIVIFRFADLLTATWAACVAILSVQLGYLAGVFWRAFRARERDGSSKPAGRVRSF